MDLDKWTEIFQSISKHRLRAVLTAFGVFWGIFMLIVLMGAGKGLENGVMRDFNVAKNAVFIWTMRTSIPYKGHPPGRSLQLTNADIEAIRQNIPETGVLAPRLPLWGSYNAKRGNKSASFSVFGDYPEYSAVFPIKIIQGRSMNQLDIREKRKVAVIGTRVQEVLFDPDEDPIGAYIQIGGVSFKVVGVFDSLSQGEDAIDQVQTIYVPLPALQKAFSMGNRIGWLAFLPAEGISAGTAEERVKTFLKRRLQVHPDDPQAFGSNNVEREFQDIQNIFAGINIFSWMVAIGTIIAAIVGVGNIMMIIVKERTEEFGIRKAVGATPWSIISMIMLEALVLTGLAGYLGMITGCFTIEGIRFAMDQLDLDSSYFADPQIHVGTILIATLLLIFSGMLAGVVPALRAANVKPVVALRNE